MPSQNRCPSGAAQAYGATFGVTHESLTLSNPSPPPASARLVTNPKESNAVTSAPPAARPSAKSLPPGLFNAGIRPTLGAFMIRKRRAPAAARALTPACIAPAASSVLSIAPCVVAGLRVTQCCSRIPPYWKLLPVHHQSPVVLDACRSGTADTFGVDRRGDLMAPVKYSGVSSGVVSGRCLLSVRGRQGALAGQALRAGDGSLEVMCRLRLGQMMPCSLSLSSASSSRPISA